MGHDQDRCPPCGFIARRIGRRWARAIGGRSWLAGKDTAAEGNETHDGQDQNANDFHDVLHDKSDLPSAPRYSKTDAIVVAEQARTAQDACTARFTMFGRIFFRTLD